jgi:RNA recognition motif-containing protein
MGMRLLVRNLARSTTEADLKDLFETWGPVQSCTIVLDAQTGRSKGFGFIEMPKVGDAKAAVRNLNGTELDGERIRVKNAKPKQNPDGDGQQ